MYVFLVDGRYLKQPKFYLCTVLQLVVLPYRIYRTISMKHFFIMNVDHLGKLKVLLRVIVLNYIGQIIGNESTFRYTISFEIEMNNE